MPKTTIHQKLNAKIDEIEQDIETDIRRWTAEALDDGKAVSLCYDLKTGLWTATKPLRVPFSIARHLAGQRQIS